MVCACNLTIFFHAFALLLFYAFTLLLRHGADFCLSRLNQGAYTCYHERFPELRQRVLCEIVSTGTYFDLGALHSSRVRWAEYRITLLSSRLEESCDVAQAT